MAKPFELSEQTAQLITYLRSHDKGSIVPYAELTKLIGMQVRANYPRLVSARNILRRDHAQVWMCIKPNVGIRRLNDAEIVEHQPWYFNGARNKLNRSGENADAVDMQLLDIDQQTRFSVDAIQRQLTLEALSRATRRRMEKVARGTSNDLPAFTAVEWAISLSPKIK